MELMLAKLILACFSIDGYIQAITLFYLANLA
jgi:hypothetical protein